jgi:hypothetical protein
VNVVSLSDIYIYIYIITYVCICLKLTLDLNIIPCILTYMGAYILQVASMSINLVRIPFCNDILRDGSKVKEGAVNFELNEDLIGLTPLEILDLIVDKCSRRNIRVLLDRHRPSFFGQSELWYTQVRLTKKA